MSCIFKHLCAINVSCCLLINAVVKLYSSYVSHCCVSELLACDSSQKKKQQTYDLNDRTEIE